MPGGKGVAPLLALVCLLSLSQVTYGPINGVVHIAVANLALQQPSSSTPIVEFNITKTMDSGPDAIISGPNQVFWFTEFYAGKIAEFIPPSTFNEFQINETGAHPAALAMDKLGRIWFSDQKIPSVWVFDPSSQVFHRYLTNTANSQPLFVLVDPANNTWFTDTEANNLNKISYPGGQPTQYSLPNPISGPAGIALQNGTSYLWIAEGFAGKIARFDTVNPQMGFQEFTPPTPLRYPVGIVVDGDGNVWVSEHGGSSVVELIPSNSTFRRYPTAQLVGVPRTGPATLAIDKLGRLWFVEHYANRVGRLDPSSSTMDEFIIPSSGAYSLLDAVDSTGNFWFTEFYANKMGMIPWNATSHVSISPKSTPSGTVTAGQTVSSQTFISNTLTSKITLSLNVTSSFTPNATTTSSEVSLSSSTLTLDPGQAATVTAKITPDASLPTGVYAVGVVATYGSASSVGFIFLQVQASFLYTLETYLPEIIIIAAAIVLLTLLLMRRRKASRRLVPTQSAPKVGLLATIVLALVVIMVQMTAPANGKCPGLPQPPVNTNAPSVPDYFGIALDVGSIAFFAVVVYLLVRSRLQNRGSG